MNRETECDEGDMGRIYSDADQKAWVKLWNPRHEVKAYKVQIYGDGFGHFDYGIDYHGEALYYFNGDWLPYREIEETRFPDFVKKEG